MRKYEIRQEFDGFVFECTASPVEPTQWGYLQSFRLTQLSESDAHRAAIFTRTRENEALEGMY